jgi:hypothetical protein
MFIANFGLKTTVQKLLCSAREILDYPLTHPGRELAMMALRDSTIYAQEHMIKAVPVETAREALILALRSVAIAGNFLECGVYKGGTIRFLARRLPNAQTIHGFDSFERLPEAWIGNTSNFDSKGKLPRVPSNVILHRGYFDQSLPSWLASHSGNVAFLHVDCDIYSSTKTIFDHLAPRIVNGTVIAFDEYFNYPQWRHHEFKAFQEFVDQHHVRYEYLAFSRIQAVVRICEIGLRKSTS